MANTSASAAPASSHPRNNKDGNAIWIGQNKSVNFYADLALKMFTQHEAIELHGLGAAIEPTIEVAELLNKHKKSTTTKLHTNSVAHSEGRTGSKPELIVYLKRTGIPVLPSNPRPDLEWANA